MAALFGGCSLLLEHLHSPTFFIAFSRTDDFAYAFVSSSFLF
jgi:hypothetical protein